MHTHVTTVCIVYVKICVLFMHDFFKIQNSHIQCTYIELCIQQATCSFSDLIVNHLFVHAEFAFLRNINCALGIKIRK